MITICIKIILQDNDVKKTKKRKNKTEKRKCKKKRRKEAAKWEQAKTAFLSRAFEQEQIALEQDKDRYKYLLKELEQAMQHENKHSLQMKMITSLNMPYL